MIMGFHGNQSFHKSFDNLVQRLVRKIQFFEAHEHSDKLVCMTYIELCLSESLRLAFFRIDGQHMSRDNNIL